MAYFVYILECSDGTYYTSVTNNLERRLSEHEAGTSEDSYTFSRRPIQLKWYGSFMRVEQAIENTTIDRLKKLEDEVDGFAEKPTGCDRFFRSGRTGEGAERLTIEQRKSLSEGLSDAMARFSYEGVSID